MSDLFLLVMSILTMLFLLLRLVTGSWELIDHIRYLKENKGVARGALVVAVSFILLALFTNEAHGDRFRAELGLDLPISGKSPQCVEEGNQIASNLNLRYSVLHWPKTEAGLVYHHQSCAINHDDIVQDSLGVYLTHRFQFIRLTIGAELPKNADDVQRFPLNITIPLVTIDQYSFTIFTERQFGPLKEKTFGAQVVWSF